MNVRKILSILFVCICIGASHGYGQAKAVQFANCFSALGSATIHNEFVIVDPGKPKIVVLAEEGAGEALYLFSLENGKSRVAWHLSKFPQSIEVIDPNNLQIKFTDDGPVITLHGCARHLCGGKGSAGALMYFIDKGKMCSAVANWDSRAKRANISYSSPSGPLTELEKGLLDDMLKDEGY
jgi:hypothetical protein